MHKNLTIFYISTSPRKINIQKYIHTHKKKKKKIPTPKTYKVLTLRIG
jgi:hypothetical protein